MLKMNLVYSFKKLFVKDEPGLLDAVQSYHPKGLPKRPFSQKSQVKDETNDKDKYILLITKIFLID